MEVSLNTETRPLHSCRDTVMLSNPPATDAAHILREMTIPIKDEARRILSIITQSYQSIPSNKWLYDGEPEAERCPLLYFFGPQYDDTIESHSENDGSGSQAGSEIWTSSDPDGEIQSVMACKLPHKVYEAQGIRNVYAERLWGILPEDKVNWLRDESGNASAELRATLEFKHEDSVELQFLFTDPSSRSQGHGTKLIEKMKELSERNGLPFWLSAHNDGTRSFYELKGGLKRGSTVELPFGHGKSSDLTAFTYIPDQLKS
ncbi:hypothetical protein I203_107082 [Kwoniella mangroviensis CBS 8507]|uniref:hypothetical protein n=1 Tax=Kwoniella mangroviensis CBS 8507 TaxID=1296122 RepID=UPI00080D24B9|nr:uncharacterized protein I203_01830 [Kwoniella mangroviensis CBS 8507]OCF68447.1 hypothetical protein I203_01830 [Kwoniella mangroviensis CBS 8507]